MTYLSKDFLHWMSVRNRLITFRTYRKVMDNLLHPDPEIIKFNNKGFDLKFVFQKFCLLRCNPKALSINTLQISKFYLFIADKKCS